MYTLYTDKIEDFSCDIGVEGTSMSKTSARIVLETSDLNLMFPGEITASGTCKIPIRKLKGLLDEGITGNIKLEVIADDVLFSPWEDEFAVKTNKKVTVEVHDKDNSALKENKSIKVTINKQTDVDPISKDKDIVVLEKLLKLKGITKTNLNEEVKTASLLIEKYVKKFQVQTPVNVLLDKLIKNID